MEKEGLVHFQRDTLDRRKLRIYLTDKALKLKTPLLRAAGEANSILLGGLTQAQEILLKTMLGTVRSAAADAIAQFELQSAVKESPTKLHLREEERQATETKRTAVDGRGPRIEAQQIASSIRKRKA
jgi:hypothetical protein